MSLRALLCATLLVAGMGGAVAGSDGELYAKDTEFALEQLEKQCSALIALKKIDWAAVSKKFRDEAKSVKTPAEERALLVRLLARLRDGHAEVRPGANAKDAKLDDDSKKPAPVGPGMFWCRIGKAITVKNAYGAASAAGIEAGSEVVKVAGEPAAKWMEARIAKLSDTVSFSTDQHAFFYACAWGLAEPPGTMLELELKEPKGSTSKKKVVYDRANPVAWGPAYFPPKLKSEGDVSWGTTMRGLGYIHVRRCPGELPAQIDAALMGLGKVRGVILDFRGNSGGGTDHESLMGRFIPAGKTMSFCNAYKSAGPNPFGGPIVVIVDGTVRSTGETAAGIFKEDGRGYMIGESPTAGMSSHKTTIELPSKLFSLHVSTSSNKERFNGGRGIEGIGVVPHEIVEFKAADLADKKDTLILRAEELLAHFPQDKVQYDPTKFGWK